MNKILLICFTGTILLTTGVVRAQESAKKTYDTRWFISPLAKFQFQDFGMLEINRKGYLSDANKLAIQDRGNASFAASAYKNLTERLSISADIGLSFGHVTNDQVLISQTQKKTYNLINATFYYHLLNARYRLQPFVSAGVNGVINDNSYLSAPVGFGVKFNSKKIMIMGQAAYGYALGKSISNTLMYSVGFYLPIRNKKKKQSDAQDSTANGKEAKKDSTTKADSALAKNGAPATVINNIYITINMDSVLKARGILSDSDDQGENNVTWGGNGSSGAGRNKKGMNGNKTGSQSGDIGQAGKTRQAKRRGPKGAAGHTNSTDGISATDHTSATDNSSSTDHNTSATDHTSATEGTGVDTSNNGLAGGSTSAAVQSGPATQVVNASGGRAGFDMEDSRLDSVDGKPVITFLVYFEFNEYSLTSRSFTTVDRIISKLRENQNLAVDINGYTDDVGTVGQNNYISKHRAQMVFDYMNSRGIGSDRMSAKFFGKDNPVADNNDPNLCWLNRRVEVLVREK